MKAPFNKGLSDFLRNSLMIFAGAFPISAIIMEVFPFKVYWQFTIIHYQKLPLPFPSKVFFTTANLISALKQALLKFEVVSAFKPEISAR